LHRVAVCCSVLQRVAVWCIVSQCVVVCCSVLQRVVLCLNAVCFNLLQCVAFCFNLFQCVAVYSHTPEDEHAPSDHPQFVTHAQKSRVWCPNPSTFELIPLQIR